MNIFQNEPIVLNQVQKSELVNNVYRTDNLSIFKQISGNRTTNLQHIKRLVDSIKTYGMKCNPILVNEKFEVIDGQHRLIAAEEANSFIYYIIINGYTLNEVHTLNLNQKNWTKKDFMEGYANMGIESYIKLREFAEENNDFTFSDCIALCSNISTFNQTFSQKYNSRRSSAEIFEEGTWKGKNFELGQDWANKIRMIKPYYSGYNRRIFVTTIIQMLQNNNFDFNEFMHKLKLQPTALVDCANNEQCKILIEEIYNFKSRNKINLRY